MCRDDDLCALCLIWQTNDLPTFTDEEREALLLIGPIGPMSGRSLEDVLKLIRLSRDVPAWRIRHELLLESGKK